ncbi:threonylcarbamoyl-AMP synthase [Rhodocyclus tenuis]|uniref:Threonylcarbamoyl-AMP synthase n=2 Tax=Rhodocyclus TaxID=1064 RepID=A0A6L5JYB9_RHOTE|nr:L-threonylcarbamoyladenylate synthase [Rhodocyclus gracilis]MQY52325.1 threonylcarbamoyl-AMP synthase [Rhodocyclus gracilis]NJA89817.1 threonylcarbamoyl-AMP synthase [Rhodocyclus gracilis]
MSNIDTAVALLRAGQLVALPTETVYGLAADAADPVAVSRIFRAKGRPADHPLIVHLPGADWLERWAVNIPPLAWELAEAFWPGPLTLILQRAPGVPDAVTGGQDTVGIRIPAHPLALEVLRAFAASEHGVGPRGGLAAPSANRFGRLSPTTAEHVRTDLGDAVSLILDGGPCPVGIESTIIDLSRGSEAPPRLLRPGRVTPAMIASATGIDVELPFLPSTHANATASTPRVSGSLDAHYAPRTPMRLVARENLDAALTEAQGTHSRVLALRRLPCDAKGSDATSASTFWLPADAEGVARALYDALHQLDAQNAELILAEAVPESAEWVAIADRLRRAACGAGRS